MLIVLECEVFIMNMNYVCVMIGIEDALVDYFTYATLELRLFPHIKVNCKWH